MGKAMSDDAVKLDDARQTIEALYAASQSGDLMALLGLLDPEVLIEQPPFLPYGGQYRGHEGFAAMATAVGGYFDFTGLKIVSLTAEGARAFGVVQAPFRGGGHALAVEEWTVCDGLVTHCRIFWFDPAAAVQFSF
jgi:hypothetical protein